MAIPPVNIILMQLRLAVRYLFHFDSAISNKSEGDIEGPIGDRSHQHHFWAL